MSIHFLIKKARKHETHKASKPWWVLHPSNDAVLAMCDTEEEAERVICLLDAFVEADAFGEDAPRLISKAES